MRQQRDPNLMYSESLRRKRCVLLLYGGALIAWLSTDKVGIARFSGHMGRAVSEIARRRRHLASAWTIRAAI